MRDDDDDSSLFSFEGEPAAPAGELSDLEDLRRDLREKKSVLTAEETRVVQAALLAWYDGSKRDLPWRQNTQPYAVWVSETMLQQTRVATVIEYYKRWMRVFPTVSSLAGASLESVREQWAGLGFYRRAELLQKGAQHVVKCHGGSLPRAVKDLLKVPGIGQYTAAAVASICYNTAAPAVDGNVIRVTARYLGAGGVRPDSQKDRTAISDLAASFIHPSRPGDWNQAVMDLGSTICTPTSPKCGGCPLQPGCRAASLAAAGRLPAIEGVVPLKKRKLAQREEAWVTLVVVGGGRVAMTKRPEAGLLGGLWEFPSCVAPGPGPEAAAKKAKKKSNSDGARAADGSAAREHLQRAQQLAVKVAGSSGDLRHCGEVVHVFSHVVTRIAVYRRDVSSGVLEKAVGRLQGATAASAFEAVAVLGDATLAVSEQMRKVMRAALGDPPKEPASRQAALTDFFAAKQS
ncbi:Adenine DNA glycosylase [Diplonema papillatum]|nr:Adenine DNA glycosylase [Diplonema papillatum]